MRIIAVLAAAAFALGVAACGFGTDDDTGRAQPGLWWPWVCPDGGTPNADNGCLPAPDAADGGGV
jgi:hypothetical protein